MADLRRALEGLGVAAHARRGPTIAMESLGGARRDRCVVWMVRRASPHHRPTRAGSPIDRSAGTEDRLSAPASTRSNPTLQPTSELW